MSRELGTVQGNGMRGSARAGRAPTGLLRFVGPLEESSVHRKPIISSLTHFLSSLVHRTHKGRLPIRFLVPIVGPNTSSLPSSPPLSPSYPPTTQTRPNATARVQV